MTEPGEIAQNSVDTHPGPKGPALHPTGPSPTPDPNGSSTEGDCISAQEDQLRELSTFLQRNGSAPNLAPSAPALGALGRSRLDCFGLQVFPSRLCSEATYPAFAGTPSSSLHSGTGQDGAARRVEFAESPGNTADTVRMSDEPVLELLDESTGDTGVDAAPRLPGQTPGLRFDTSTGRGDTIAGDL